MARDGLGLRFFRKVLFYHQEQKAESQNVSCSHKNRQDRSNSNSDNHTCISIHTLFLIPVAVRIEKTVAAIVKE